MTSLRIRVGAICRENESILLVEHEKGGERYWLLPGGGMRAGEVAADALAREVFEETSIKVETGRLLCVCESISPDHTRHIVHFVYEAGRISGVPGGSRDPRVRGSAFVPIVSLDKMTIHPPFQSWLMERLSGGFADTPEYLGAMWA